jgi:hypothetical protein
MKAAKVWAMAAIAVLAVAPARSGDNSPDDVFIANATITSLGDLAWGDPRVPPTRYADAVPFYVQLDDIEVLIGGYVPPRASVVLRIAHAPAPPYKVFLIATRKGKEIFQVLDWRPLDWPLCLTKEDVKKLQLGDAVERSRFAHWNPNCGWEIRQSSGVYGIR